MGVRRPFSLHETHGVLQQFQADIALSSEQLGWASAYASMQRERPFEGRFEAISDALMVLHRSGPVEVSFKTGGRAVEQQLPSGSIFFLPAGHECAVSLHAPLDTIHIYLRSDLFHGERNADELVPLLGVQDGVLAHLGSAMGAALEERQSLSSLFVDSIAQGIARRFLALRGSAGAAPERNYQLSAAQLRRIREFVEAHLETDLRLDAIARAAGLGTKTLLRGFKATCGTSPYQYVIAARIERAKHLLHEDASLGLAEIAARCGFSHQEHLTRMFRRLVGQTPGRYRRCN